MPANVFMSPTIEAGFEDHPLVIADIGARDGIPKRWNAARAHLRVLAFEPDPEECARLTAAGDKGVTYFPVALHSRSGSVCLNIARNPGTSSILEVNREFVDQFPESDRFEVVRKVEVPADTLDHVLTEAGVSDLDVIKVDTQGAEREILLGSEGLLRRTVFAVEAEVEFSQMYVGQPLFRDVDALLSEHGFVLFDLRPSRWKRTAAPALGNSRGQLVFGDALYFRSPETFAELLGHSAEPEAKMLKCFAVCIAYGYHDYAAMLYQRCGDVASPETRRELERFFAGPSPVIRRIGSIRGVGRLVRMLRKLADSLDNGYHGWATGDRRLGND